MARKETLKNMVFDPLKSVKFSQAELVAAERDGQDIEIVKEFGLRVYEAIVASKESVPPAGEDEIMAALEAGKFFARRLSFS